MGTNNEVSARAKENGSDDSDGCVQRIAETFSQHHIESTPFRATVTVRQLRSEGLSFQLWPTANAMCLYMEKEFGEGGISTIDLRTPHFQRDVAHWNNPYAVLEMNRVLGDRLPEKCESNSVLGDSVCSVTNIDVSPGDSFKYKGRQRPHSRPEVRFLHDTEGPLPSRETGNQMDPGFAGFGPEQRQTKNRGERTGARVVDEFETLLSLDAEAGNIHIPMRRMRVLELGSGTGMVGIVAACLGAQVLLTDLPHVIPNVSYNLDRNRSVIAAAGGSVEARVLRWGVEEDVKALGMQSFDLILASDCVYQDTSYKPFLQTLNWLVDLGMDPTDISVEQKSTIPKGTSSPSLSQLVGPAVRLLPLHERLMPGADASVNGADNGEQSACQIDSEPLSVDKPVQSSDTEARGQGRVRTECSILLGHMRRWKKDSHFFRMASKCFNVDAVHRHPPEDNARIGPIVYRLSRRSSRKTSSRRRTSSSFRSLSSCSPSRR